MGTATERESPKRWWQRGLVSDGVALERRGGRERERKGEEATGEQKVGINWRVQGRRMEQRAENEREHSRARITGE